MILNLHLNFLYVLYTYINYFSNILLLLKENLLVNYENIWILKNYGKGCLDKLLDKLLLKKKLILNCSKNSYAKKIFQR